MEPLVLVLATAAFIFLLQPEIKPPSKKTGDKLMDGILSAANDIKKELGKSGEEKVKKKKDDISPLNFILFAVAIGFLVTFVL